MKPPTQTERILKYIYTYGFIDRLRAFIHLGIFELAARITDLEKQGYRFEKTRKKGISRDGFPFGYVEYRLRGDV